MTDYVAITTLRERSKIALTEARAKGIEKRRAIIITAVSWNEAAAIITRPRADVLQFDRTCWTNRITLGWEWGRTNRVPYSWQNDSEVMGYLDKRGVEIGQPLYSGTGDDMRWAGVMRGYDGVNSNDEEARAFEFLIHARKAGPMVAFSIGPTQQYMCYSPLVAKAYASDGVSRPCEGATNPKGETHVIANRFPTWEDLWSFYTAPDAGTLYAHPSFGYLPVTAVGFPTAGMTAKRVSDDPSGVEYYLSRHQTGYVNWKNDAWKAYADRFANANNECWALASSIY